ESDLSITQILYGIGQGAHATYTIDRAGKIISTSVEISGLPPHVKRQRLYLEIVGLYCFLAGTLILIQRSRSPYAIHFHFVCLVTFVQLVYTSTGQFDSFDWIIFWLDLGASALLPPLFLHFCLEFPLQ